MAQKVISYVVQNVLRLVHGGLSPSLSTPCAIRLKVTICVQSTVVITIICLWQTCSDELLMTEMSIKIKRSTKTVSIKGRIMRHFLKSFFQPNTFLVIELWTKPISESWYLKQGLKSLPWNHHLLNYTLPAPCSEEHKTAILLKRTRRVGEIKAHPVLCPPAQMDGNPQFWLPFQSPYKAKAKTSGIHSQTFTSLSHKLVLTPSVPLL